MKEWHKQARKMLADGMTVQAIASHFHVSWDAAKYAVDDNARARKAAQIEKQKRLGTREATWRRHENGKRERMLAVAREYGCGDAV